MLYELFAANPVAQTIGLVAMIGCCASYQTRTPRRLLLLQAIAGVAWCVHFGMLGAFTGAAMNILGAGRNVVYMRRNSAKWIETVWCPISFGVIFAAAAGTSGIIGGEGWRCLLSMTAQVLSSFVLYSKSIKLIRWLSIVVSLLWLVYDAISGSIPGTLCEVINQMSLYVALFRFRRDKAINS